MPRISAEARGECVCGRWPSSAAARCVANRGAGQESLGRLGCNRLGQAFAVRVKIMTPFPEAKMTLEPLRGRGLDIEEPDWSLLIPDPGGSQAGDNSQWRDYAHREWLRATMALREA